MEFALTFKKFPKYKENYIDLIREIAYSLNGDTVKKGRKKNPNYDGITKIRHWVSLLNDLEDAKILEEFVDRWISAQSTYGNNFGGLEFSEQNLNAF